LRIKLTKETNLSVIMEHFPIIQALCRTALSSASKATIHQIERLKLALEQAGQSKEAAAIGSLLTDSGKTVEMSPSKIERSKAMLPGETLTRKTPIPVDKESAIPLAEIIFAEDLPDEAPVLNENVQLAIDSILNEWTHFETLDLIGTKPSRSCLIYGVPGTGKTHLALWIAKQINLPVVLARLDGLMSSFLGTSSRNIGNLFSFASRYQCILLLDEFDAIAKLRNDTQEVGEIKRVVNTLLQHLDARAQTGFTIAVTNHEKLLDPAIWRRFEVQINIPRPAPDVMTTILRKFLTPLELTDTQMKLLAWTVENGSGADAKTLVQWIKKSSVLDPTFENNVVTQIRRFATLNSGRVAADKRDILMKSDQDLIVALSNDNSSEFKQKEIASLFNVAPSTASKIISKSKI
jgi:SpoVK/Ycf46/Vps4 family AAA+-type ATPase